jgi:transcription elongation factor GreA
MVEKPVYVTAKGLADLEADLKRLNEERSELIDRLTEVKSSGDWMEDTEQMMFEDELSFLDLRIQETEDMLANARLISTNHDASVVDIGDRVVIKDSDGIKETFTIVGISEADPGAGLISNESPLGRALLARKVGDRVVVEAPAGSLNFEIIAIKRPHP